LPEIADRWEVLKKVGVSVADKLSGEKKARRTQRLVLEDEEGRLAESYAHLLALTKAVSEEAPEVPESVGYPCKQEKNKKGGTKRCERGNLPHMCG
jgi:hypothetical protein